VNLGDTAGDRGLAVRFAGNPIDTLMANSIVAQSVLLTVYLFITALTLASLSGFLRTKKIGLSEDADPESLAQRQLEREGKASALEIRV